MAIDMLALFWEPEPRASAEEALKFQLMAQLRCHCYSPTWADKIMTYSVFCEPYRGTYRMTKRLLLWNAFFFFFARRKSVMWQYNHSFMIDNLERTLATVCSWAAADELFCVQSRVPVFVLLVPPSFLMMMTSLHSKPLFEQLINQNPPLT